MGIIVKPNTFTGQTAPQLPWIDAVVDALYALVNGEIDNLNLATNADIAQSKIHNLLEDLGNRLLLAGGVMTGRLDIEMINPYLRLIGSELNAKDWRILESGGVVALQVNTGTRDIPVWVARYFFDPAGAPTVDGSITTKAYVDAITDVVFGKVVKTDGDVAATGSYADVPGLSITRTTKARRARVTFCGIASSPGNNITNWMNIRALLDDVQIAVVSGTIVDGREQNGSFSVVTDVLTAATHTFKIQIVSLEGAPNLAASATKPAVLSVEELINAA